MEAKLSDWDDSFTLHAALRHWAEQTPDAAALMAPGRAALGYAQLWSNLSSTARLLRELGIRPGDRVAIVLPQGPELPVAVLSVAAVAAAMPFNPVATGQDFAADFSFLSPKALLVQRGDGTRARDAATACGIPILELVPDQSAPAGVFSLETGIPGSIRAAETTEFNGADDVALVLSTSGTTSRSKFVPLSHRNVRSAAENTRDAFRATPADRCLVAATLFHAHGLVAGVMSSLVAGAAAICPPGFVPEVFFACLDEFTPTWYTAVPTVHQGILRAAPKFPQQVGRAQLRAVRSASAYLPDSTRTGIEQLFGTIVVEGYGLTEAMQLTNTPLDTTKRKVGSLGLSGTSQIAIMDEAGKLLAAGETGEIVARGPVCMAGYIDMPDADAAVFRNGWFRSGDYGYLNEDGHLYMTGRIKDQINRGGEKISPQEIDRVLLEMPALLQALAFGIDHPTLGEDVAAAVVLRPGATATTQDIRRHAEARLPEHMLPRKIYIVPAIPQNTTGKLLRRALAEQLTGLNLRPTYVAPRDEREQSLVSLWEDLLDSTPIGIHDNFFDLGGQSLLAAQLLARIRKKFQVQLPFRTLFERPTIAQLSLTLAEEGQQAEVVVARVPRGDAMQLSYAQQRLWFLEQMDPGSTAYCMPEAFRLQGELDLGVFQRTIAALMERHEALRTRFGEHDGEPVQWIDDRVEVSVPCSDLSELSSVERDSTLDDIIRQEFATPFDLGRAPLFRVRLVRLQDAEHILLLNMHHIISDGWSKVVLTREISAIYEAFTLGTPAPLPPLALQYVDYAYWQRSHLRGSLLDQQLDYWKRQLGEAPQLTELPTDKPRPATMRDEGQRIEFQLPVSLSTALAALCRHEGVTLFQLLLAAFHVFLARYSRQPDVITGSPVAGRQQTEFEPLVGCFVNTLALRSQVDLKWTFRSFLAQVRETTLAAYQHQDVPFEKIVETLQPQRSRAHTPLFQVMFILQNNAPRSLQLPGVEVTAVPAYHFATKFDLTLSFEERSGTLTGYFEYRSDLFKNSSVERMAANLQTLLNGVVSSPHEELGKLPLVSQGELSTQLEKWAQPEQCLPPTGLLHSLFEQQVAKTPGSTAITFKGQSLTYSQLEARANQLAQYLLELGVRPDTRVALVMERSLDLVIAILGVLKSGGAWVPIDPGYPAERIRWMLDDSEAPILLTQAELVDSLPQTNASVIQVENLESITGAFPPAPPSVSIDPDHLAYLIYTSGTTGRPKGAMVHHRGVHSRLLWQREAYDIGPADVFLQKASISFDVSVWETFVPLISGARLVLAEQGGQMNPQYLVKTIEEQGVTSVQFVPSMLRLFLDALPIGGCATLRQVFSGGEALSLDLRDRFFSSHPAELHNFYGPTETSGAVTRWTCARDATDHTVPIGRPVAHTQAYVLDENHHPVPIGVAGQLWIGGVQVGRGYLNRDDLTAERFLADPFSQKSGASIYATGDLVRWSWDGTLEFLGRLDNQVKLHGVRIELGEVEAAVTSCLDGAAVAVLGKTHDGQIVAGGSIVQLVAFVVSGNRLESAEIRSALAKSLPSSLIPTSFVAVNRLPLTPNGKLDRRALSMLKQEMEEYSTQYKEPENELQRALVSIWEEVLGRSPIGIDDDFFDLGGHSLLAIRLFNRIGTRLRTQPHLALRNQPNSLQPSILWTENTIRLLAGQLSGNRRIKTSSKHTIRLGRFGEKPPLFLLTGVLEGEAFYPRRLSKILGPDQPIIAYAPHDITAPQAPLNIQAMAEDFLARIKSEQPRGPYLLAGYSHAGLIAFEIARRLEDAGERVAVLFIIDTTMPVPWLARVDLIIRRIGNFRGWPSDIRDEEFLRWRYRALHARNLWQTGPSSFVRYYVSRLARRATSTGRQALLGEVDPQELLAPSYRNFLRAVNLYFPRGKVRGKTTLVSAKEGPAARLGDVTLGWSRVCETLQVLQVPGEHSSCLSEHVDTVAGHLRDAIELPSTCMDGSR
jgi:amino acid adenylation domain-containing protein